METIKKKNKIKNVTILSLLCSKTAILFPILGAYFHIMILHSIVSNTVNRKVNLKVHMNVCAEKRIF